VRHFAEMRSANTSPQVATLAGIQATENSASCRSDRGQNHRDGRGPEKIYPARLTHNSRSLTVNYDASVSSSHMRLDQEERHSRDDVPGRSQGYPRRIDNL
jgi:hypothetical protein